MINQHNLDIEEIKGRLDKRTQGDWESIPCEKKYAVYVKGTITAITGWGRVLQTKEDADFIAHAPDDIANLLSEVERLHGAISKWIGDENEFQDRGGWERFTSLEEENKRLREALGWYSDSRHYQQKLAVYPSDIDVDGGEKAIQALEGVETSM